MGAHHGKEEDARGREKQGGSAMLERASRREREPGRGPSWGKLHAGERGVEDRERRGGRGKKPARVEGDKHHEKISRELVSSGKISREWGGGGRFFFCGA